MPDRKSETGVVIVAAGRGERAGGPKQYRLIGGRPVLAWTLDAFLAHPLVGDIVVVVPPDDAGAFEAAVKDAASRVIRVPGGSSRQESVRLGLDALAPREPRKVLIHDAARPFVDAELIGRVIAATSDREGALPCLPVSDTLKRGDDGKVRETVSRDGLHMAQTPQAFPFGLIHEAHRKAARESRLSFTDDAAIAEWAGIPVKIVAGSSDNVKLTWPKDLEMADLRLSRPAPAFPDVRTGNGYDVHAFEPGEQVVLCGVPIPFGKRLSGHSDADVALHALTDALLATCGQGDIGTHFPPSDPEWRGVASRVFVEHAVALVRERGGRIANVDVTLIAEGPRIGPYRQQMVESVAAMLGTSAARVSIKATTNEKLGFVGREEGIAAIATASVVFPGEISE